MTSLDLRDSGDGQNCLRLVQRRIESALTLALVSDLHKTKEGAGDVCPRELPLPLYFVVVPITLPEHPKILARLEVIRV